MLSSSEGIKSSVCLSVCRRGNGPRRRARGVRADVWTESGAVMTQVAVVLAAGRCAAGGRGCVTAGPAAAPRAETAAPGPGWVGIGAGWVGGPWLGRWVRSRPVATSRRRARRADFPLRAGCWEYWSGSGRDGGAAAPRVRLLARGSGRAGQVPPKLGMRVAITPFLLQAWMPQAGFLRRAAHCESGASSGALSPRAGA